MKIKLFIFATFIALQLTAPTAIMAQAYGDGNFNDDIYNGSTVTPTPSVTPSTTATATPTPIAIINTPAGDLPITGTTLSVAASLGALLLASGLALWAKNHRNSSASIK